VSGVSNCFDAKVSMNFKDHFKTGNAANEGDGSVPYASLYQPFFCPNASVDSWTQTLGLGMVRRVLYHCATAAGYCTNQ